MCGKGGMDVGFTVREVLPGVRHIQDAMGVCMTLLTGEKRALLVDAGYGLEDVAALMGTLTDLPVTVALTHHHHDHALGARWFPEAWMFPEDRADWPVYTGEKQRRAVREGALAKGLAVGEDFLTAEIPMPRALEEGPIDLGGLTAEVIRCPGHTPGSAVVWVPERRLLLTGDDWNPCTWLFFPAALPVHDYLRNVRELLALPFEQVLCSHQPGPYPRKALESFLSALTDDALRRAEPVNIAPYEAIDTRQALLPGGQMLVFDWAKAELD